jgi:pyridinium-3,5-biscarboxylic acid mononucleotide synthase
VDERTDTPPEVPDATIDHHRELRTGQAEAVYGPGKTPAQVRDIAAAISASSGGAVFVTRATPDQFHALLERVPTATYAPRSRLIVAQRADPPGALGAIAVVSAGTSDLPVADEAAETAAALGIEVTRVTDVGVAGIHRVMAQRERIEGADVAIVVAGMDGALPTVVAGLTSTSVIAVPTSVGYGASFDGLAALLTMLNGCAPGVTVVNIDNGFGAAQAAYRMLTIAARRTRAPSESLAGDVAP